MSKNSIRDTYFSDEGKSAFYEIVNQNLFVGMELANYDSLCRVLNITKIPSFGKSRLRHNAAFNCFFKFHREENSNRIIIDKIYPFNKIKEYECPTSNGQIKKDSNKRELYIDHILPLLQDYVARYCDGKKEISFTSANILLNLGFVNNHYISLDNSIQNMYNQKKYDNKKITIHESIQSVCLSTILKKQFEILKRNGYIQNISNDYIVESKIGKDNCPIHYATEEENNIINSIKDELESDESNIIHWNKSINTRHINYLINLELNTNIYNFTIKGIKWHITFTDKFIPQKLSKKEIDRHKKFINEKSQQRVSTHVRAQVSNIFKQMNSYGSEQEHNNLKRYYITEYKILGTVDNIKKYMIDDAMKYIQLFENEQG